jgi:hypothetical protein
MGRGGGCLFSTKKRTTDTEKIVVRVEVKEARAGLPRTQH